MPNLNKMPKGDTIIEVMFAITVFCLVSILSISLMNSGVSTAQASLELTMARNEIDAQAEALRFIQNSYIAERGLTESNKKYKILWDAVKRRASQNASNIGALTVEKCSYVYETPLPESYNGSVPYADIQKNNILNQRTFILNTRRISTDLDPREIIVAPVSNAEIAAGTATANFVAAPLYPRIIFTNNLGGSSDVDLSERNAVYDKVSRVEGIWNIMVNGPLDSHGSPEFYDFHIRTCWYAPGRNTPTTIGTIIRLYNPENIE